MNIFNWYNYKQVLINTLMNRTTIHYEDGTCLKKSKFILYFLFNCDHECHCLYIYPILIIQFNNLFVKWVTCYKCSNKNESTTNIDRYVVQRKHLFKIF